MLPTLTLVLGGARSGKSAFAEKLVTGATKSPVYWATAQAFDAEMAARIAAHRSARANDGWQTIEEPLDVERVLKARAHDEAVLLDCATLWLSNVMTADLDIAQATDTLLGALTTSQARIVVVSNEIGMGVVPDNALARRFSDAQGQLNQTVAAQADLVVAVMAGLPMVLKGTLP